MYYVSNPKGATVTIFAPYDCKNNCPFCVNKKEYKDNPSFDIDRVLKSMEIMSMITPNCDFVITGGEPLADLVLFDKLVNKVRELNLKHRGTWHKLFVNTTLPITREDISQLNSYAGIITGFNISRHIGKYTHENSRELIDLLKIPVRINCVLYTVRDAERVIPFINEYGDYPIQFRDNYIGVNEGNVFDQSLVYRTLLEKVSFMATPDFETDSIPVHVETFRWNAAITDDIHFHRTTCYSKLKRTINTNIGKIEVEEINDIIINPRGEILDDWNEFGSPLNLREYCKAINI